MYLIKFTPGFGELVAGQLTKNARIVDVEEDIALFEAAKPPDMPYASQLYRVLGSYRVRSMADLLRAAADDRRVMPALRGMAQGHTFRIRCMQGDRAVSAEPRQIAALENSVERAGLIPDRARPEHELRLWLRGGGRGLFLMKLGGESAAKLPPGTLRSDLCHMLCLLGQARRGDVCLDPFCGSGAIARAMARYCDDVTASDIDPKAASRAGGVKGVRARMADALGDALPEGKYSLIITDPPWGLFRAQGRADFADALCRSVARLLTREGRCVLFLDRSVAVEDALRGAGLALARRFDALYAGHKVKALLLERAPEDAEA